MPSFADGNGVMERVLIIADDSKTADTLQQVVSSGGYNCITVNQDDVWKVIDRQPPHLIIVDNSHRFNDNFWKSVLDIKKQKKLPVMALIGAGSLAGLDDYPEIDDFVIYPCDDAELLLRIKRLLQARESDNHEKIRCEGLIIDLVTCEVTIDGKKAELTYKEFELLKLMASHRGRVFNREALLDKIWGYDYYGGDRTVDVHMRRLRSKIEDANHTYIETVRNIGYRFIKES